jgi:hypothetical protein
MPIGIPEGWEEYAFRIVDQADTFQVVTIGIRNNYPVSFDSHVFWNREINQREKLPITLSYETHSDAELGHTSLVQIGLLAEDPDEFLTLFEMTRRHIRYKT